MTGLRTLALGAAAAVAVVAGEPVLAQDAVAEFYKGKRINLLIGGAPGGSYDIPGRLMARYMGKHIPGNPSFVVENMYGAASLQMTNHLYVRASRDGTTMGIPNNNIVLEPALKIFSGQGQNVQFDATKFYYLGTPVQEPHILFLSPKAPAKSLSDLKTTKVMMGSVAAGATNHTLPQLVNSVFGTKFEMITGYKGPPDIMLAVERGEVHGVSTTSPGIFANRPGWFEGESIMIMQFGPERLSHVKHVPTAIELAPDESSRDLFKFIAFKFTLARLFTLPPDVPADRARALRKAFDDTVKDPELLAEAKKMKLDIAPVSGEESTKLVMELVNIPAPIVDKLRPVLAGN